MVNRLIIFLQFFFQVTDIEVFTLLQRATDQIKVLVLALDTHTEEPWRLLLVGD